MTQTERYEGWTNYEWEYLSEELEIARSILVEFGMREGTDGVAKAIWEIGEELGRIYLPDLEMLLMIDEYPFTIVAMPKHIMPNDVAMLLPQTGGYEYPLVALVFHYDLEGDLDDVYEQFGTTWKKNLLALKDTGIGCPTLGRNNMFSLN